MDSLLHRRLTMTAVYWSSPTSDGYGGSTFADPVEVKCRWQWKDEIITGDNGEQIVSSVQVFLLQDVDEGGYLYYGELDDLTTTQKADPRSVAGASRIIRFVKTANMKNTEYVRKAFLR